MKSRIICLPDISKMEINPEYLANGIEEAAVEEMVETLSKTLGETVEAERPEENCGLICEKESGEALWIYPDMHFEGIEILTSLEEVQAGSSLEVNMYGQPLKVTVKKILVTKACPEDQLAKKAGIEGVTNTEELKAHLREKEEAKNKESHSRQLVMEMIGYLAEHSEKEIDEEEISTWTKEQARLSYEENLSMGIDLRITEEGMITEEEVLAMLAGDMRGNFNMNLAARKYAEECDFAPDEAKLRAAITEELEQMGITDAAKIENQVQTAVENDYFRFIYESLMEKAQEVLK